MGKKWPKTTMCQVGGYGPDRRGATELKGGCYATHSDAAARSERQFVATETCATGWAKTIADAVKAEMISHAAGQHVLSNVVKAKPYATVTCGACRKHVDTQLVARALAFDLQAKPAEAVTMTDEFELAAGGGLQRTRRLPAAPPVTVMVLPRLRDEDLTVSIMGLLDVRSAARLARVSKSGLKLWKCKVSMERLEATEQEQQTKRDMAKLKKQFVNDHRPLVKTRKRREAALKTIKALHKDAKARDKAHKKELKACKDSAECMMLEYKQAHTSMLSLCGDQRLMIEQLAAEVEEKLTASDDGVLENLKGIRIKLRQSTRGRPALLHVRDTVAKLHVKYCLSQDQCVPAYVDMLEDAGAVVVDSITDSGAFTKAVVHEHGELARADFCIWAAQSTVPNGFTPPQSSSARQARRLTACQSATAARWLATSRWTRAGSPSGCG